MSNMNLNTTEIGAIILAAGKGTRMKSTDINKVVVPLADKPMILHAILLLKKLNLAQIVVVVGFAKESVLNALSGVPVQFAEQKKRLGTGHAVMCGLKKVSSQVQGLLILNGDDSAFYTEEIIKKLIHRHNQSNAAITFLSVELDNPYGLGRVVRAEDGSVTSIVEEKDATPEQRLINEVNTACYLINREFLNRYITKIEKSPVTGEYYLVSLVELAYKNNEKIETLNAGRIPWRGINTREELAEAEKMFGSVKMQISTAGVDDVEQ